MGHGRGPGRLGSSGTSVGLHLRAAPLGNWAGVHHAAAGWVGSWAGVLGVSHRSGRTVSRLSLPCSSYSPLVRECSGALGAARGAWVWLGLGSLGAILFLFQFPIISSLLLSLPILPPHISPPPPVNRPD